MDKTTEASEPSTPLPNPIPALNGFFPDHSLLKTNGDVGSKNDAQLAPAMQKKTSKWGEILKWDILWVKLSSLEKFRLVARVARVICAIQAATYMKRFHYDADDPESGSLCPTCKRLELSPNKFIIHDHAIDRNQQAAYLLSRPPLLKKSRTNFPLGSGSGKIHLGSYDDIKARWKTCPFCFLVISSLKRTHDFHLSRIPINQHDTTCEVSWNVDGREALREDGAIKQTRPRTRRIRLHWSRKNEYFEDSYLVMVGRELSYKTPTTHKPWESESLFLGRRIKVASQNLGLIKDWLGHCDDYHGDHCKINRDDEFKKMVHSSYFGVIDIHTMALTHLPENAKYIALSYVWGEGSRYQTKLLDVEIHKKYGGIQKIMEYLPAVIRESIELVRTLKERYLWVDSLCVVQDSRESWKLNSQVMDVIYGNAYLTICAADGRNAKASLKAISPIPRNITQYIEECAEGVTLMVSHLAETFIERSRWNTRGWTFQERLLSKRCLIFAEGRMFFQCRSTAMSEDIVTEQKTASWSIELVQAPLQLLHQLQTRAFRVYMECMRLYTGRVLSKPKDILAAFHGMSNLIGSAMGSPLIFGLPSSHFDMALLWQPKQGLRRREPSIKNKTALQRYKKDIVRRELELERLRGLCSLPMEFAVKQESNNSNGSTSNTSDDKIQKMHKEITTIDQELKDLNQKVQEYEDFDSMRFPSWSWCGWQGEGDPRAEPSRLYYNREMLEGCLANVHQWLLEHTWIHWYIRDDHGDLRPIWQSESPKALSRTDTRWKGYGFDGTSDYGRRHKQPDMDLRDYPRDTFKRTLPDYPFRASFADRSQTPNVGTDDVYLQFHTWSAHLKVWPCEVRVPDCLGRGLRRYDITDYTGDWCGTIVLDEAWGYEKVEKVPGVELEFLAISDAKNFTEDENDIWTYYIPKERSQADWDLYYVLLVEHNSRGIASRVGLGKVFREAFSNSCLPGLEWKEIIME